MTASIRFAKRLTRFLAAGIPAFAAALLANLFLVDKLHWPKPVAYIAVLWLQMTINFFACRLLVFEIRADAPIFRQYTHFMSGNGAIRLVEWLFYTILVEGFHVYYLTVQIASIFVFAVAKFKFAEALFEWRKRGPAELLPRQNE